MSSLTWIVLVYLTFEKKYIISTYMIHVYINFLIQRAYIYIVQYEKKVWILFFRKIHIWYEYIYLCYRYKGQQTYFALICQWERVIIITTNCYCAQDYAAAKCWLLRTNQLRCIVTCPSGVILHVDIYVSICCCTMFIKRYLLSHPSNCCVMGRVLGFGPNLPNLTKIHPSRKGPKRI